MTRVEQERRYGLNVSWQGNRRPSRALSSRLYKPIDFFRLFSSFFVIDSSGCRMLCQASRPAHGAALWSHCGQRARRKATAATMDCYFRYSEG